MRIQSQSMRVSFFLVPFVFCLFCLTAISVHADIHLHMDYAPLLLPRAHATYYIHLSMNYRNVEKCEFGPIISHLGIIQWFLGALRTNSKPVNTNQTLSMFEALINSLISSSEVPLPHQHCLDSRSDICVHFCPRLSLYSNLCSNITFLDHSVK